MDFIYYYLGLIIFWIGIIWLIIKITPKCLFGHVSLDSVLRNPHMAQCPRCKQYLIHSDETLRWHRIIGYKLDKNIEELQKKENKI